MIGRVELKEQRMIEMEKEREIEKSLGLQRVVLEMDSMTAIRLIQGESIEFHSAVLQAIKEIIQYPWMIKVTHILRQVTE
ncbi:hypothetical protein J1N35_039203 [Gossypium stocksii]|uniref:RNase H type-1 domain-containing protein n=1 Tax=Gossypium stocksii TaxID=47602 RepID=A0A9D3UQA1_9ROSI|nr:hypothetical protein J1N35_039203 [Gossypium stocksii]